MTMFFEDEELRSTIHLPLVQFYIYLAFICFEGFPPSLKEHKRANQIMIIRSLLSFLLLITNSSSPGIASPP